MKSDGVLALALVGARARGFHHDLASKLQGLMMTIDELSERGGAIADVRTQRAVITAIDALRDIQAQLVAYRSLARGADPHDVALRDLIEAGARCANVALAGALPDAVVATTRVAAVQAIAMACELADARGPVHVDVTVHDGTIDLALRGGGGDVLALARDEAVAVIRYALARDGGDAHDSGDCIMLRFKLALTPTQTPSVDHPP